MSRYLWLLVPLFVSCVLAVLLYNRVTGISQEHALLFRQNRDLFAINESLVASMSARDALMNEQITQAKALLELFTRGLALEEMHSARRDHMIALLRHMAKTGDVIVYLLSLPQDRRPPLSPPEEE